MEKPFSKVFSNFGLIRIKLIIAGKPFYFLVDSGSTSNVLTAEAANELQEKLQFVNEEEMMGVGRKKLRNVVVRMYLRFNKRDYVQYFSIVESMPAFDLLEQNNGIHFDGILGTPFLYQTKAIIDFVDQKIRWDNDREQKKLWGWQWLWKNDPPW